MSVLRKNNSNSVIIGISNNNKKLAKKLKKSKVQKLTKSQN